MKNKLLLLITFITSTSVISQNNFFNKTYKNSSPNIEFGVGYLLSPADADYAMRYQFASRNILLNKKLGFLYTIEPHTDNTTDLFGINYRFSKDFSFQAATGIFNNSFFDSNDDAARKNISVAYHPDYMPLTVTAGYSIDMGPSIGINYRIFFNKNKKKNIDQVDNIKSDLNQNRTRTKNNLNKISINTEENNISKKIIEKTKSNIIKKEVPLKDENISKESTKNINNEQIINQKLNEKKITNKINSLESVSKPIKQKTTKKKIKKPTINTEKLCDESKVLYSINEYEISILEKNNLKKLSKYLKDNPNSNLIIYGSADKSGSKEYNLTLSDKRARSSKNYLIELGVNTNQLKTIALGESKAQNANSEIERAQARSTMFEIVIEK